MWYSLFLLALLAHQIKTQSSPPPCSNSCYESYELGQFGCSPTDYACDCSPGPAAKWLACLQQDCDATDLQTLIQIGESNCAEVGYPITYSLLATVSSTQTPATSVVTPSGGGGGGGATSVVTLIQTATATDLSPTTSFSPLQTSSSFATNSLGQTTTTILFETSSPSAQASSNSGGGLSVGAQAGIGAGVGGAVLVVGLWIVATVWLWRRRNTTNRFAQVLPPPEQPPLFEEDEGKDEEMLARMRRLSDDGTAVTAGDRTAAGRTNDEFRPQAA